MNKLRFVTIFVMFALLLAACGSGNENTQGNPDIGDDIIGTSEGVPVTGETPLATVGSVLQGTATTPDLGDGQATVTVEQSPTVATGASGGDITGVTATPVVDEGAMGLTDQYPNALSELGDYVILDQDCAEVADVDGFVISTNDGQILYVVATATGDLEVEGRLLIPWAALDVNMDVNAAGSAGAGGMGAGQTGTATQGAGGTGAGQTGTETPVADGAGAVAQQGACDLFDNNQAFRLNIVNDDLSAAPVVADDQELNTVFGQQGWDEEFRTYWSGVGIEVEQAVGGADAGAAGAGQTGTATQAAGGTGTGTGTPEAGGNATGGQTGQATMNSGAVYIESVNDVVVRGTGDEDLGGVADAIVDPEMGQITHIVLSVGGFLGIGERYVVVPFDAVTVQVSEDGQAVVILDADQSRLENAPGYESLDDIPNTQEQGWDEEFESYWTTGS